MEEELLSSGTSAHGDAGATAVDPQPSTSGQQDGSTNSQTMEELAKLQKQLTDMEPDQKKPEHVQSILDSIKSLCGQLSEYGEEFVFIAKKKDENRVQIVSAKGKQTIESNVDIVGKLLKESNEETKTPKRGPGRPRKYGSQSSTPVQTKSQPPQTQASTGRRPGRPRKNPQPVEVEDESEEDITQADVEEVSQEPSTRRRGRPRKSEVSTSPASTPKTAGKVGRPRGNTQHRADNSGNTVEEMGREENMEENSTLQTSPTNYFGSPSRTSSRKRKPSAKLREIMSDAKERQRHIFSFDAIVKTEPVDEDELAEAMAEGNLNTEADDAEEENQEEDFVPISDDGETERPRPRRKTKTNKRYESGDYAGEISDTDNGSEDSGGWQPRRGRKRRRKTREDDSESRIETAEIQVGENIVSLRNQLRYECKVCKQDLLNVKALQKHILVEHKTQCTRCLEDFPTAEECRAHVENCSKRSHYECGTCGKVCTNEGAFSIHMKSHDPVCRFCKEEFPDMLTLKSHRVQCSQMRYIFNKLENLKSGRPRWKPRPSKRKKRLGEFKCDVCHNGYPSEKQLNRHRRRHDERYRCSKCKEIFPNRHTLLIHMQACTANINLNNTTLTCEKCGKTMNNMGALVLHQKSHKTECSYCKEDFLQEEKYREHKKQCKVRQDTLEQQRKEADGYKCCVCRRVFFNMGSKRKHEISHTRDYRFIAEMCGISLKEVRKVVAVQVLTFRKKNKGMTVEEAEETFFAEKPGLQLNDSSVLDEVEKLEDESMINLEKEGVVLLEDEVQQLITDPEFQVVDNSNDMGDNIQPAETDGDESLLSREDVAMQNVATEEAGQMVLENEPVDIRDYKITELVCKMCEHQMTSLEDLFDHIKVHRKYACHLCCKMLSGPKALEVHIKQVHIGERKAMCSECGKGFKTETYLRKHIDVVHKNARPSRRGRKRLMGPFICEVCNREFDEKKKLTAHSYSHHPEPQQCPKCDKVLQTTASLRHHLRSVHIIGRPFQCPNCSRCYKTINNLREHIALHHSNKQIEAKHKCEQCNRKFFKKAHLLLHEKTHTSEKPLPCHHCGKRFLQRGNLNKHIAVHHLKERPYQCELCEKAFTIKELWSLHMRIHAVTENRVHEVGDKYGKIYKCPRCENRYFPRKSGFVIHMRCHEGDRPYKCPICSRAFYQSSKVYRHLHTHFEKDQFTNKQIQQMFRPQVLKMDMRDPQKKTRVIKINIRGEVTEEEHIEVAEQQEDDDDDVELESLIKQSKERAAERSQDVYPIIRVLEGGSATKRAVEASRSTMTTQPMVDSNQVIIESADTLDATNIIMEEISGAENIGQAVAVSTVNSGDVAVEHSQAFVNVINKLMSGEENAAESVIYEQPVEGEDPEDKIPSNIRLVQIGDEYYVTDEHGNIRTDYQVHVQQPEEQPGEGENMILIQE